MARRKPRVTVRQLPTEPFNEWTVESIKTALDEHERGYFFKSAQLASAMGRDERISGCIGTRVRALLSKNGVGFELQPAEHNPQRAPAMADRVSAWWPKACSESTLGLILRDIIQIGPSISRVQYTLDSGELIPKLVPWPMEHAYFTEHTGRYSVHTTSGTMEIDPEDPEWLVIEPTGQRPWMFGGVRASGLPFYLRTVTHRDWSRFCEKHGIPILAISEPDTDPSSAQKKAFYERLRKLGREAVLRLPQNKDGFGFDAKIIEPTDTAWKAFDGFLSRLDTNIAVFYLGQNLTTEVQGGSFAAAQVHARVRQDYLDADAEVLSTALREVIKRWGRLNVSGWRDDLAPWPTWRTKAPEDQQVKAATLFSFSQALEKLLAKGVQVDVAALAEAYGVPMLAGPAVIAPAQPEPTKLEKGSKADVIG